jgi:hypothetical protein
MQCKSSLPHTIHGPLGSSCRTSFRERVLFIGTQFSILYTSRMCSCTCLERVCCFWYSIQYPLHRSGYVSTGVSKKAACVCVWCLCLRVSIVKHVLGHSQVSQPPNSGYASSVGTLAFSLRHMPPRPATDDALTHASSSAALLPAPLPSHGPIAFTFLPRPDLHYVHLR